MSTAASLTGGCTLAAKAGELICRCLYPRMRFSVRQRRTGYSQRL
jgi:hypothetical protein